MFSLINEVHLGFQTGRPKSYWIEYCLRNLRFTLSPTIARNTLYLMVMSTLQTERSCYWARDRIIPGTEWWHATLVTSRGLRSIISDQGLTSADVISGWPQATVIKCQLLSELWRLWTTESRSLDSRDEEWVTWIVLGNSLRSSWLKYN